jgi:hypothetical protein
MRPFEPLSEKAIRRDEAIFRGIRFDLNGLAGVQAGAALRIMICTNRSSVGRIGDRLGTGHGTDEADCQSAAGYHPAPRVFKCDHSCFSSFVLLCSGALLLHCLIRDEHSSQMARGNRSYRRAYLAISNADGPEAEAFDRLNGPTHSNTPRYCNRPSGVRLRVCLRQNYGFESKVSRGRNHGRPSPPYCDVPRPRRKLVGKSWVNNPFSIRVNHMKIELERKLSVKW